MRKPPIQIEDCSKVELHIHVLGYFPKGESILIVLWDGNDNTVLRSILVDCYERDGKNIINKVLDKYGLDSKKLDYIVWTHPDLDHSLGMHKIIRSYSSKCTQILLPAGFKRELFKSIKSELMKVALTVFKKSRQDKESVVPVSTSGIFTNGPTISDRYQDGITDGFNFSIEILAPFSESSFRWTEVLNSFNKNDISIAFNIHFGNYRFLFGGDAMNYALTKIDEERMVNTMFVKIPHHGSHTSDKLPTILQNIDIKAFKRKITAVTTTFVGQVTNLPDTSVLDQYKCISRKILHTNKNAKGHNNYGICSLKYKYNSRVPDYNYEGDAYVYYESTNPQ